MVPVSKGLPRHRKRVRRPRHRPVRHSPEPSDPGLHQPVPGPECPSPGRSQRRLELSPSGLRLSTDADLAEGSPEDPAIVGSTSSWWLRHGRPSPGFRTYSISPWQPHSRFRSFQTSSHRRCNARPGRTATRECTTTTPGCCPEFPQSERLFSGDCRQNRSPTTILYQIHL